MFDKIYIINISEDTIRRNSISTELESIGWNSFEFIDAVKGSDLTDTKTLIENGVLSSQFIDPFGLLTKNIIACALSHKKAYKKFLEDGYSTCLILEDDVRLSTNGLKFLFNGNIDHIQKELNHLDWDVFIWGLVGPNVPHYDNIPYRNGFVREYKKYNPDWAAHAYQITRKSAHQLIDNNTPIKFAADVNLETSGNKIYCTPWTLIEQNTGQLSRFYADKLEQSFKNLVYDSEFSSKTSLTIEDKSSLCGNSQYDIYFSPDRNIRYESRNYSCKISKEIEVSKIEFKQFIDKEGTVSNNWCHITF